MDFFGGFARSMYAYDVVFFLGSPSLDFSFLTLRFFGMRVYIRNLNQIWHNHWYFRSRYTTWL